jgi:hypothetical protein
MCAINPLPPDFKSPVAQISAVTDLTILNVNEPQRISNLCKISVQYALTDSDFSNDIITPIAHQHLTYGAMAEGLPYSVPG